jgi:hypothetical protein
MLNELLKSIPLKDNYLTEGFILVNQILKFEYKRYYPEISAYRMDNKTYEVTKNKIDMFSQPIFSLNELIKLYPQIVLPELQKNYLDIKIQPFPENEPNLEVREIRNQLTSFLYSGTVTLNGIDYLVEVDKTIVNYISYFLYDHNEYISFEKKLNELFIQLCKNWNDSEYNRLLKRIEEINQYQKSSSAEKTSQYLEEVKFKFDEWYRLNKITFIEHSIEEKKSDNEEKRDFEILNNELNVAHNRIKKYRDKLKYAKISYEKFTYSQVVEAVEKTKKRNGNINYSALARKLGLLNHHAAKKLCNFHGIKY